MRVVIDTNVFVSSFLGGNPRKIIDLWKNGKIVLCLSEAILDEYMEVLYRMGLGGEREMEDLLYLFSHHHNIVFTKKTPQIKAVKNDPDDDKFVECAMALKAETIITGDKDLIELKQYGDIKILNPRQFINQFNG